MYGRIKIVEYICDAEGRHPDYAKVIKILDWPEPADITGARAFLGVCVYYLIGDIVPLLQESDTSYESEEYGREQTSDPEYD